MINSNNNFYDFSVLCDITASCTEITYLFAIKLLADAISESAGENSVSARFGGDEFVCAKIEAGSCDKAIEEFRGRFQKCLDDANETSGKPYKVSASLGAQSALITEKLSVEAIIAKADKLMYTEKSSKKRARAR